VSHLGGRVGEQTCEGKLGENSTPPSSPRKEILPIISLAKDADLKPAHDSHALYFGLCRPTSADRLRARFVTLPSIILHLFRRPNDMARLTSSSAEPHDLTQFCCVVVDGCSTHDKPLWGGMDSGCPVLHMRLTSTARPLPPALLFPPRSRNSYITRFVPSCRVVSCCVLVDFSLLAQRKPHLSLLRSLFQTWPPLPSLCLPSRSSPLRPPLPTPPRSAPSERLSAFQVC